MKARPHILPVALIAALTIFVSGAASQVMEIDSITGQPSAGTIKTGTSSSGFDIATTYASKAPFWKVTFGGKSFNSDVTETSSSATSSGSITVRHALPRKTVGPATLVITPVKDAPFILNYRLVSNK